jgi:phosphoribosylanthranilate isomerase
MRDADNIVEIASLRPDYMGFIFYEKSPRFVGGKFSIPSMPSTIKKVGVFVNATVSEMLSARDRHQLDFLQLHGQESVATVKELKKSGAGLFKVFSMDDDFDFSQAEPFEEYVDFFLFDTKGKYHGGNATTFNWNILARYQGDAPFLLSGGLTLDNIDEVKEIGAIKLQAVDLNSGVESSPGVKDKAKVLSIVNRLENLNKRN